MTEETPKTQVVEPEPKKVEAQVEPVVEKVEEDVFDKDRAMKTIQNLREIEKKNKQELKELETLKAEKKQREDAELTESQRLSKQADELKAQNAQLQDRIIRGEVVAEIGLPADFAKRLQGATKEEMLADAKELLKSLPQIKAPHLNATNPSNAQVEETDAQKRARLFPDSGNPFDYNKIIEKGGGVKWTTKNKE